MTTGTVSQRMRSGFQGFTTQISEGLLGAPIRLGVTGLARSGKTVFITSLISNLMEGGRMPQLAAFGQNRIQTAFLQPQPDDTLARFDFEAHLDAISSHEPFWPVNTKNVSQLRLSMKLNPPGLMSGIRNSRIQHLDIVDYPGEWILDLTLLDKSYAQWSEEILARLNSRDIGQTYAKMIKGLPEKVALDETQARKLAHCYCSYLSAARATGYSGLTPGRFLLPGDLEGSPVLTFAPLPPESNSKKGSLWHEMQRRYTAYKRHIVRPFFKNHFARIDRQIVLIDVLEALHRGPSAIEDLRHTMRDILIAFRPGRHSPLGRLIRGMRVERILFAATKADHLHHNQHVQLTAIMEELTDDAARQAQFRGAQTKALSLASVRSTTEETRDHQGRKIDCVRGIHLQTRRQAAFFAGELPINPKDLLSQARQGAQQWLNADYSSMHFLPPPHALRQGQGIAHIRLDKAAQFLFGDRL